MCELSSIIALHDAWWITEKYMRTNGRRAAFGEDAAALRVLGFDFLVWIGLPPGRGLHVPRWMEGVWSTTVLVISQVCALFGILKAWIMVV